MQKNKAKKKSQAKPKKPSLPNPPGNMPGSFAKPQKNLLSRISNTPSSQDGRIVVRNREFLANVDQKVAFTPLSYSINPGLSTTFPWLSNIANNYEFYHFKRLVAEYVPAVGTLTSGSVTLAFDFDSADALPSNKARLLSYLGAMVTPAYQPISVSARAANLSKFGVQKFTRSSSVPVGKDVKTYDVANLIVMADGGSSTVGMIFLDYEVELYTPHTPEFFSWEDSALVTATSPTVGSPFSTSSVVNADSAEPIVQVENTTQLRMLKAGQYILNVLMHGTSPAMVASPASLYTPVDANGIGVSNVVGISNVVGTFDVIYNVLVDVIAPGLLTVAIPSGWTTIASMAYRFAPYRNLLK